MKKYEVTIVWRTERIASVDILASSETEAYDKAAELDPSRLDADWDITHEEREVDTVYEV